MSLATHTLSASASSCPRMQALRCWCWARANALLPFPSLGYAPRVGMCTGGAHVMDGHGAGLACMTRWLRACDLPREPRGHPRRPGSEVHACVCWVHALLGRRGINSRAPAFRVTPCTPLGHAGSQPREPRVCMPPVRKLRMTCSCVGCAPAVLPATAPLAPRGEQGATRTPGSSSTVMPVLVARAPDLRLVS